MTTKMQPLRDLVVVNMDESHASTSSGIVLPHDEHWEDHESTGVIEASGPDCVLLAPGDRVVLKKYRTHEKARPETFKMIIPESEIMAKL